MSKKFYIYAARRWREIDIDIGNISGWEDRREKVKFVYLSRGKLRLARTGVVLRGLRDLAEGRKSTVRDGPALTQKIRKKRRHQPHGPVKSFRPLTTATHSPCHCCNCNTLRSSIDLNSNKIDKKKHSPINQHTIVPGSTHTVASRQVKNPFKQNTNNVLETKIKYATPRPTERKIIYSTNNGVSPLKKTSTLSKSKQLTGKLKDIANPLCNTQKGKRAETEIKQGICKELIINETDLEIFRNFLVKHTTDVELHRFDADDEYKKLLFYRINPLVNVERCSEIDKILKRKNNAEGDLPPSNDSVSSKSAPKKREYSNAEDHAIVAWLMAERGRERIVNGNRLWKELQEKYQRLTGIERSWHSLRNRYLRHILVTLPQLALSPSEVNRLRAGAANPEVKSKRNKANSGHTPVSVQTWPPRSSRTASPHELMLLNSNTQLTSPRRVLRSSVAATTSSPSISPSPDLIPTHNRSIAMRAVVKKQPSATTPTKRRKLYNHRV